VEKRSIIPKSRPFYSKSIGDCSDAMGKANYVGVDRVEEMIRVLLSSLPEGTFAYHESPVGRYLPEKGESIPFRCRFINRNTRRKNAGVRWSWDEECFLFTFYPYGLNEQTIIHETAHLPAWGSYPVHGLLFKKWMSYLTRQWFGEKGGTNGDRKRQ